MKHRLIIPKFLSLLILIVLTLNMPLYAQHHLSPNQHPPLSGYPQSSVGSVTPISKMSSSSNVHQIGGGVGTAGSVSSFTTRSMPQMRTTINNIVPLSQVGATTAPQLSAVGETSSSRPRKIGGGENYNNDDDDKPKDNPDPYSTPLGNLPLLLMLLLTTAHTLLRRKLKSEKLKS